MGKKAKLRYRRYWKYRLRMVRVKFPYEVRLKDADNFVVIFTGITSRISTLIK